jgi:uncharacterized membrane protein YozB (DUF420 family)
MVDFTASTVSMIIQLVVFTLLIVAIVLKYQKKFRYHGITMFSAVVLHLISILAVMTPSISEFFAVPELINYADSFVMLTMVHIIAGILAAGLGIWLVSVWHLKTNMQTCFKNKRIMDITFVLWLLSIVLGVVLYLKIIQAI